MTCDTQKAPLPVKFLGVVAILFGAMTLYSGGSTLFIDGKARAAAGNFVGFVLWFNFLIGFAYIRAGVWIYRWQKCGFKLSIAIAGARNCGRNPAGVRPVRHIRHERRRIRTTHRRRDDFA
jgi:hypothetical protein